MTYNSIISLHFNYSINCVQLKFSSSWPEISPDSNTVQTVATHLQSCNQEGSGAPQKGRGIFGHQPVTQAAGSALTCCSLLTLKAIMLRSVCAFKPRQHFMLNNVLTKHSLTQTTAHVQHFKYFPRSELHVTQMLTKKSTEQTLTSFSQLSRCSFFHCSLLAK